MQMEFRMLLGSFQFVIIHFSPFYILGARQSIDVIHSMATATPSICCLLNDKNTINLNLIQEKHERKTIMHRFSSAHSGGFRFGKNV